jgi:hypothetical protein
VHRQKSYAGYGKNAIAKLAALVGRSILPLKGKSPRQSASSLNSQRSSTVRPLRIENHSRSASDHDPAVPADSRPEVKNRLPPFRA